MVFRKCFVHYIQNIKNWKRSESQFIMGDIVYFVVNFRGAIYVTSNILSGNYTVHLTSGFNDNCMIDGDRIFNKYHLSLLNVYGCTKKIF